jgi:DNA-binding CsgD family transcriptional regulator
LRQRRMEHARRALLRDPHLTNSKAALLAGYVGVAAFEAAYFKQFHETPAETRRRGLISGVSRHHVEAPLVLDQSVMDLSPREREVCDYIAKGLLNKQTAIEMGLAEKTVQEHRARAMRKLGVASVAELARLWERLGK